MQQNQPKGEGSREQDNPALSQVVEINIRALIHLRAEPEDVLAEIHRLPSTGCHRSSTIQGKPYESNFKFSSRYRG